MDKPKRYIEFIKNITIVVLFFTAMLLLYFFWGNPIPDNFRITDIIGEEPVEIPTYQEVTRPGRIIVHLGEGSYTVLKEEDVNAWGKCLQLLQGLPQEEILRLEEITVDQFDKIMENRSIAYHFYYDLPLESFLAKYEIPEIPGSEQIGDFSIIGFSSGSPESLFIYSGSNNKYFRIVCDQPHTSMDELLEAVEKIATVSYYRIGDLVGTSNRTVVPLSLETSLREVACSREFEDFDTAAVKEFAQTFFGESFDFVRKIEESKGTHIYMYGYGEKVLTISADGKVEYKNKEKSQGAQQSYSEALESAVQFVAAHGGWQTEEGMKMSPYVQYAQAVESNKQKGYRFVFGMRLPEGALYLEGSHPIMVELINGEVTQYLRDMIQVEERDYLEQMGGSEREAFSAINMIAQHYSYIASILAGEGYDFGNLSGEDLFDAVSQLIQGVKTGYVKPGGEEPKADVLIPAWIVKVDHILLYFDLYDTRPLGYTDLLGS